MSKTRVQKRGVVDPEPAYDQLLNLLGDTRVRAEERYDRLLQKLIRFFATQLCGDPEELASETITRACRAISSGLELTSRFETFLFGVAKNVALEDYRRRQKADLALEELPADREPRVHPTEDTVEPPRWKQDLYHECLQRCLETLEREQREQLILFYQGNHEGESKNNRRRLAISLGISTRALSSRMLRIREKLDQCIKVCVERKKSV